MLTIYSVRCRATGEPLITDPLRDPPTHCPHVGHEHECVDEYSNVRVLTRVSSSSSSHPPYCCGEGQQQGPSGPSGPAGPAGGPSGPTGESGPSGPSGGRGEAGPSGPTGERGPTGESGPSGPNGERGEKGDEGHLGPMGETGYGIDVKHVFHSEEEVKNDPCTCHEGEFAIIDTGDANDSAHGRIYICSNGEWHFMVDITCCHELMRGPRGLRGEMGGDGCRGRRGAQGKTGAGVQGARGCYGWRGPQGDTGRMGTQGAGGKDGCMGKGVKGDSGPQGRNGVQGKEGKDGCKGDTGSKGDQGEKGEEGCPGKPAPPCPCRCSQDNDYSCGGGSGQRRRRRSHHNDSSSCCNTDSHSYCNDDGSSSNDECTTAAARSGFVGVYEGHYAEDEGDGMRFLATLLADGTVSWHESSASTVAAAHGMWRVQGNFMYMNVVSLYDGAAGWMRRTEFKFQVTDGHFTEIGTGNAAGTGCQAIFSYSTYDSAVLEPRISPRTVAPFILFKHGVDIMEPSCGSYP